MVNMYSNDRMKETVETMIIKEICNKLSVSKHTQTCTVNSSYNAKYIIGKGNTHNVVAVHSAQEMTAQNVKTV